MRPRVRPRLLCARTKMIFSVREAAAYLGLSPSMLRRRIAGGEVPAHPWGARQLLLRADLDRLRRTLDAPPPRAGERVPVGERATLLLVK